jgi:hypothetical protein
LTGPPLTTDGATKPQAERQVPSLRATLTAVGGGLLLVVPTRS